MDIKMHQTTNTPSSAASRLFLVFFGLFFGGIGLVFVVMLGHAALQDLATFSWTETTCQIVESKAERTGADDESPYQALVKYRFAASGQEITSDRITRATGFGSQEHYGTFEEAAERVHSFPPDASVQCFYNPDSPEEAVLLRRSPWYALIVLFPLIFVIIGAGVIYAGLSSSQSENTAAVAPLSGRAKGLSKRATGAILMLFFLPFFFAGCFMLWSLVMRPYQLAQEAKNWTKARCTITSSSVRTIQGDESTSYRPDIFYDYSFNGRKYQASRFSFQEGSSSGYREAQQISKRYRPGSESDCWVNTANPSQAVLLREFEFPWLLLCVGLLFAGVGVAGFVFGLRSVLFQASTATTTNFQSFNTAVRAYEGTTGSSFTGPLLLKPAMGRVARLFVTLFVALFWNAITWIVGWGFLGDGVSSWNLIPLLILSVFALIGVALIFGFFHGLLALANPIPEIQVSSAQPRLGESVNLTWRISGRVERLENFRVWIEGTESATYRRGTNTSTDTRIFAKLEVLNVSGATLRQRSGSASFALPHDLMHSFDASNNKIIWMLKVHGVIERWPDMSEEFPLTVAPVGGGV